MPRRRRIRVEPLALFHPLIQLLAARIPSWSHFLDNFGSRPHFVALVDLLKLRKRKLLLRSHFSVRHRTNIFGYRHTVCVFEETVLLETRKGKENRWEGCFTYFRVVQTPFVIIYVHCNKDCLFSTFIIFIQLHL